MCSILRVHSNHSLCLPLTDLICSVHQDHSRQKVASILAYMCSIHSNLKQLTLYKPGTNLNVGENKMHPAQPRFARLGGCITNWENPFLLHVLVVFSGLYGDTVISELLPCSSSSCTPSATDRPSSCLSRSSPGYQGSY